MYDLQERKAKGWEAARRKVQIVGALRGEAEPTEQAGPRQDFHITRTPKAALVTTGQSKF